jgi:LAS superfamily LD-carboxypeptidase LdcB
MNAKNWPIVKVTLPADLKGVKPGEVPAHLLRDVQPEGKLHWRAADAYHAMRDKALADGIKPFKPTSAGDTYRSLAMQTTVFLQRYQKQPIAGAQTRTWEGVKWYKKSPTLASLAAPGTSQHNLGIAVDIWSASGKRFEWMLANALDFGFSWEVVPEEPWHLRYTAGDNVPPAVQAWLDRKKAV